jgi:predicted GH43/DUF377 family glycosyl hydrolase
MFRQGGRYIAPTGFCSVFEEFVTPCVLSGNFECNASIGSLVKPFIIFFASQQDKDIRYYWEITDKSVALHERVSGSESVIYQKELAISDDFPWQIRMVRSGAYSLLYNNEKPVGWMPLFSAYFPDATGGLAGVSASELLSASIEPFAVGSRLRQYMGKPNEKIAWMSGQILPGPVLEKDGVYYQYFIGVDKTAQGSESGGQARMGIATSTDMLNWDYRETPFLETMQRTGEYSRLDEMMSVADFRLMPKGTGAWDGLYLFVNGAVWGPDGKPVVMYSGNDGHWWRGLGIAVGETPLGPFTAHPDNPIFPLGEKGSWDEGAMHEFDLVELSDEYILFYTGFDGKHDRGGIARSKDLIHWERSDAACFGPQFEDWWDTRYVRPRSLLQLDDYYYLFYEGCNFYHGKPYGKIDRVFDTVGLARSKDLTNWEYHPRNPIIAESSVPGELDSGWTGWPKAVVRDGMCYLLHSAGGGEGGCGPAMNIIPLEELTNW